MGGYNKIFFKYNQILIILFYFVYFYFAQYMPTYPYFVPDIISDKRLSGAEPSFSQVFYILTLNTTVRTVLIIIFFNQIFNPRYLIETKSKKLIFYFTFDNRSDLAKQSEDYTKHNFLFYYPHER
jgi:hypothetical protein